jgi:hypothetical protein
MTCCAAGTVLFVPHIPISPQAFLPHVLAMNRLLPVQGSLVVGLLF